MGEEKRRRNNFAVSMCHLFFGFVFHVGKQSGCRYKTGKGRERERRKKDNKMKDR